MLLKHHTAFPGFAETLQRNSAYPAQYPPQVYVDDEINLRAMARFLRLYSHPKLREILNTLTPHLVEMIREPSPLFFPTGHEFHLSRWFKITHSRLSVFFNFAQAVLR